MVNERSETPLSRGARAGAAVATFALFAVLRILHLAWRSPFFDELFTVWISRFPPHHILEYLRHDSGPPLYYFLVHLVTGADPSVLGARLTSLAAASALAAAILLARRLGDVAPVAALLLAVFAPHVYFAAEGRAYALAGALAGIGCLALDAWAGGGSRRALAGGAALLVAAAAAHYYGVLFFAVPFALGVAARSRRRMVEGAVASLLAGAAFAPGFLLAARQPSEAIAWMRLVGRPPGAFEPLRQLAFIADYPAVFIAPPPAWIAAGALVVTAAVAVLGLGSAPARRWAVMTLVPVALAMAFGAAGMNVYFPVRFEAVLAGPFACWLAFSLFAVRRRWLRASLMLVLVALGLIASYIGVMTALARRPDRWRQAATFVRRAVPDSIPIVASGYAYLEVMAQSDDAWHPRLRGFPSSIEEHPGWVDAAPERDLARAAAALPPPPFVWVAERGAPAHRILAARYVLRPLMVGKGMIVAEAVRRR